MFEFKMSYKETGFHKPGDKPFTFPPDNVDSKLDANLIEIEGGNGTGKTTLLNCLALALGYLDEDKELEDKKGLQRKLENLDRNMTLSYSFRISYSKPESTELKMERKEGQQEKIWLNSKQIDLERLRNEFDVVFLTEDDPKKVVNASLGKLSAYFKTIDSRLLSINNATYGSLRKIREFRDFKREESQLKAEIGECERKIKKSKVDFDELRQNLEKVRQRDDIKSKIELFADEKSITSQYESLKTKYEQLREKEAPDLLRKLTREKINLDNINLEVKNFEAQITRICESLKLHGTILDSQKILENDYAEYNRLTKKLSELTEKAARMHMVDDMIDLFEHYNREEIVPLVDKPVHEALSALIQIKRTLGDDRVFGLMNSLESAIGNRKSSLQGFEKIQDKIAELSQKLRNLEGFEDIQKRFSEAERRYLELQNAIQKDRTKIASLWSSLSLVKGDAQTIEGQTQKLEVQLQSEERIRSRCEEKLRLHLENASGEPRFADKEKELQDLYEMTIRLRENAAQWIRILETPMEKRKKISSVKDTTGFGTSDHNKFVKAVGEFLGAQFEPVDYNYRLHEVKFFDIERNVFITKEDRQIPIDELSQGQSKISVLRKVFKEMNPTKRKIVLIDEIADLDAANMQFVRDTLKSKLDEGSLLLAVLVRPRPGISPNLVDIKGWA
jgi:chromosome segregation ATPase